MEESVSSFEHEAEYHDPSLGNTHLATQDVLPNSSTFSMPGNMDHVPTQSIAYPIFDDFMNKIENYPQLPFAEPSHVDTPYQHHQIFNRPQSGPQPISMHHDTDSVDNDTYTEFCGVYSPGKLSPVKNNRNPDLPYHCPRCNNNFAGRNNVKVHFSICIIKHGNPDAFRWNDHISLKRRKGEIKDKARNDRFRDALQAYSGIVIPSKLPQGEAIIKYMSSARQGHRLCDVCGGGPFSENCHVKSHFISCVKKKRKPYRSQLVRSLGSQTHQKIVAGKA